MRGGGLRGLHIEAGKDADKGAVKKIISPNRLLVQEPSRYFAILIPREDPLLQAIRHE